MRRSKLLLAQRMQSVGILVWLALLIPHSESLRGSAVILQAKAKAAEAKLVEQVDDDTSNGTTTVASNSTKQHLTGIPQIDYVHDPNLPRELNGHNLTDYPFYNAVPEPEEIDFKCDGLHDGFYASVPHKCQVYHHCLYGFRYDFLCANYTAFDQKTFICHFVSEVDCENSPKHFKRNEDLYKEASTPPSTTTTTTTTTVATTRAAPQPAGNGGSKHGNPNRRRRPGPYRRRRPVMYEYYYDDDEYAEPEYYDDDAVVAQNHRRPLNRKQSKEPHDHHNTRDTQDSETVDYEQPSLIKPSVRPSSGSIASSVYERPRVPPKIRRPVPKSERDKYDYVPKASSFSSTVAPTEKTTTTAALTKKATTTAAPASDDEYYEDEEYEYDEPRTSVKTKHQQPQLQPQPQPQQQQHNADYDFPTGFEDTHRYVPRPHRGRQPARKRTDVYDDYDVKERPRMNRRKEYPRHDERPRVRPMHRNKNRQDDEGGYSVKKRPSTAEPEYPRRRPEKRPTYDDDYYYDEEEELPPKRNRRPAKTTEKPVKPSTTKQPKTERPSSTESRPPPTSEASTTRPPAKVTAPYSSTPQRTAKASSLENETTKENEIPTTEHISLRTTPKYKMIKIPIIQNVVREDAGEEPADYSLPTEEAAKSSSTHSRPVTTVVLKTYPTSKKPLDEMPNKTITTIRHFVIAPPVRKPSHYGFVNSAPVVLNSSSFRDEAVASKLPEQKTHQQPQSQQQPQQHNHFFSRPSTQYIKVPVSMSSIAPQLNHSYHAPATAFGGYYIPIEQPLKSKQAKPVEEALGENLNAISNGINYNSAFESTKSQPYRTAAAAAAAAAAQPAQDQRLYSNGLSFPQRPPPSYDITAPGPSAPAEESNSAAVESKRYSELPSAYTANADYDVTYNDALQPSTLHPVRRYPSTSFYIQTHQNAPPRRQTSEYAFNEGTFHTLNRSQNRYNN